MRGYKPARQRHISRFGVKFIAYSEGFLDHAYLDTIASPPVWTIGYGHTGDVHAGDTVTERQARKLLRKDARWAADAVRQNVKVPLTQHMFDALVSATYNLGAGEFMNENTSTLLRLLNQKRYHEAADQFVRWNKAGGVPVEGLTRRRLREKALFLRPPDRFRS